MNLDIQRNSWIDRIPHSFPRTSRMWKNRRGFLVDLSQPLFDPRARQLAKCFLATWPYLEQPPLHSLWAHNPSICPQFFLATKPQTYKGGSGRIGERSALTPLCGPQFHPSRPSLALFRTPLSAWNSYFLPCV